MLVDWLNALVLLGNFVLIPALAYGSQLALGALGVTMVYAVLRFSNFAHGDTMAFSTMVAILVTWWLQGRGIGLGPLPTVLLALPAAFAVTLALLLASDRLVYRYYRRRKARPVTLLIASIGLMFVYNGLVRFIIGPAEQRFADGAKFIIRARDFKAWSGLAEGLTLKVSQSLSAGCAVLLVAGVFWFLHRTRQGKAMRAWSDNEDLALLSGIDTRRVVWVTWTLVALLATVSGVLYGLDKSFKPFTYFQLLLPIFAAAIVGGVGHPVGAIVGGYLVAFAEIGLTYAWRKFLIYVVPGDWAPAGLVQLLPTDYKLAVSFFILVLVLILRPTGIFRGRLL